MSAMCGSYKLIGFDSKFSTVLYSVEVHNDNQYMSYDKIGIC